jgi:hypothetical protein
MTRHNLSKDKSFTAKWPQNAPDIAANGPNRGNLSCFSFVLGIDQQQTNMKNINNTIAGLEFAMSARRIWA